MPEPTVTRIDELPELEVTIPGSAPPVTLRRLHVDDAGGPWSLVTFPAGWTRPGEGAYDVVEEVCWLEGGFTMSGVTHDAGTYTWFPAGYPRRASAATDGALALAWFSGPAGWGRIEQTAAAAAVEGTVVRRWPDVAPTTSPVGTPGRLLRAGPPHETWILDGLPAGGTPVALRAVGIDDGVVLDAPRNADLPALSGRVVCRIPRS